MTADRRVFILGAGSMIALGQPAIGWSQGKAAAAQLFADTPLAANPVAQHFTRVDMALPNIPVETASGPGRLAGVGGKTRLLALWAEWCAPCLAEIRDFARLRPGVATDRFDLGLLLTGSVAKLDHAGAVARITPLGAATMPLLIEPGGKAAAGLKLAGDGSVRPDGTRTSSLRLPCTLLLDSRGRVKGRAFGAPMLTTGIALTDAQQAAIKRGERINLPSRALSEAEKKDVVANGKTAWAGAEARQFFEALGDGLLDRI